MSNKRKKNIIIILCVLELFLIASTLISFRNRDINQYIASVSELDADMFAIMVENDDGTYSQTKESTFPNSDIYKFNNELSGCIDYSGNNVKDALTYDEVNNKVTATVSGTSYCYLYFDSKFKFKGDTLAGHLINNPGKYSMWYSGLEGDGHRFVGENPNNYVCFGTSDKNECVSNPDEYMYRIIGVFDDGTKAYRVKLIKRKSLETAYAYHDKVSNVDWSATKLYKGINGELFYDDIVSDWQEYIDNWKWTAVNTLTDENRGPDYGNKTTSIGVYVHEMNRNSKQQKEGKWTYPSAKIGLMYVSDYMLSLGDSGLNYTSLDNCNDLKTSWLAPTSSEWTMSRYGGLNSINQAWAIKSNGLVFNNDANTLLKIKPVFYLSEYVKYESGSGTVDDPIMITKPRVPKVAASFRKNKMTITITKGDNNLDSYCINTSISVEDCEWAPVTSTTLYKEMDVIGKYYVHVIDKEGYIGHSIGVTYRFTMVEDLIKSGNLWQSDLEGDGYRYVGTNPDNYVCFGTDDRETCVNSVDTYMYRIIGVFKDEVGNQFVKLIKYSTLPNLEKWNDVSNDASWGNTKLFVNLNNSIFLNNTTYVPDELWNNKIVNWKWNAVNTLTHKSNGPNYNNDANPSNIYLHEMNRSTKISAVGEWTTPSAKIGLMYASDYVLSLGDTAKNMTTGTQANSAILQTGWMHITRNRDLIGGGHEWTMSRSGYWSGDYYALMIYLDGYVTSSWISYDYAVRPTFYLDDATQLESGTGTITDPYILVE